MNGKTIPRILILAKYLSSDVCDRLRTCAQNSVMKELGVVDPASIGGEGPTRFGPGRVCFSTSPEVVAIELQDIFRRAFTETIAGHFDSSFEWFEAPEILCYPVGGEYKQHSDSDYYDRSTESWVRLVDRDLSAIVYLNDDFDGGDLVFPGYDLSIRPAKGMLVAFPSDHRYTHAALPTVRGLRFVAVSWAASADGRRVRSLPPKSAIPV